MRSLISSWPTAAASVAFTAAVAWPLAAQGPGRSAALPDVKDLPLVEVRGTARAGDAMALIISGDGGWATIDKQIAGVLADSGIAVVVLNAPKYFHTRRTPEEATHDVERVLDRYLPLWHRDSVVLVGYSHGADVLPFIAARLRPDLAARARVIALLGPAHGADFEFHLMDVFRVSPSRHALPTLPELHRLGGHRILCFFGTDETDSLCRDAGALATVIPLTGGHHFDGNYRAIAAQIVAAVENR
ncbi:MAG TPA: AcvB/VirJ family lysyl-phosphatidylglycerol hydrolase [Gemmatimonadaceae bacterium]|nr:AcvB/VirJ family lysyl-phosphatidylglycerol hydrolase [Gemmatimonadaceae bacterium]